MPELCADIGNYSVLTCADGRNVRQMRSLIYDCTHNSECQNNAHTPESPMVVIGNRKYKIGRMAAKFSGFLSAAEAGKSSPKILLPILLSNTPPCFEGVVKLLVPDDNKESQALIESVVVGEHEYSVYSGGSKVDALAEFTGVEFVREGDAAARYAYEIGAIEPSEVALIIDIGGKTTDVVVCDNDDGFYVRLRRSYAGYGGISVAQSILDSDLVRSYGRVFEVAKTMDAITAGKRYIGNRKEYSFEDIYTDCVDQWFGKLMSKILTEFDSQLVDVTKIVWVGGGAELVREKVEGEDMNIVLPSPQHANLNGLIGSSHASNLRMVA